MNIVVLGSGGWGTALAMLLEQNRHTVTLWSHDPKKAEQLKLKRENPLLPGVQLPVELQITNDLNCLRNAELVVFASPSFALRAVAKEAAPFLPDGAPLLSVTKGIERGTHLRMSQVIAQETGGEHPIAVLSGPSHAEEVARGVPTAVVAAARDPALAARVQAAFNGPRFRVYTSDDPVGVELGGAVKNVLALAVGMSDGLGFGDNSRAALVTRGVAEMARLGVAVGGRAETFSGLSGLGDLVVTCTSRHSRNRGVGERLGRGEPLSAIQAGMRQVAEGVWNCTLVCDMAAELGVEMPICETVRLVLQGSIPPSEAVARLMGRDPKDERG